MRIALAADHAGYVLKNELKAGCPRRGTSAGSRHQLAGPGGLPGLRRGGRRCHPRRRGGTRDHRLRQRGGCVDCRQQVSGIRAAVCHDTYTARQAVEHDDMNVLCLGARVIGGALALDLVNAFVAARYEGEERFQRRLDKVIRIEERFSGGGAPR